LLGFRQRILAVPRFVFEPDLNPVDDRKPGRLRRLPEPGDPVETVMVSYGKRLVLELDGTLHQIFGMGRPIEEGEISVAMEFGVTGHPSHYIEHMFDMFTVVCRSMQRIRYR
jgi:hypothetical protein